MKLHRLNDSQGKPIGWVHYCPGCRQPHVFNVEQPTRAWPEFDIVGGHQWKFDGNQESPTFSPSMHIQAGGWKRPDGTVVPKRTSCHYLLTAGLISFLGDCAHDLKSQSIPLPDFPLDYSL